MKGRIISLIAIIMLSYTTSCDQGEQEISIIWKIAAALPADSGKAEATGLAGPLTGIHNDHLVIAGGANFPSGLPWEGGKKEYHKTIYIYGRDQHGELNLKNTDSLPYPVAYGANCASPGGIIYAGGETPHGLTNSVWKVQYIPGKKSISIDQLPALPVPVANAAATSIGSYIYLAGGETIDSVSNKFLRLDLENLSKGWEQMPELPIRFSHAVLINQIEKGNTNIYLIGGRRRIAGGVSEIYSTMYVFDTDKNTWIKKASMPYAMAAGTGLAIGSQDIFLFGGDRGETFKKVEGLIAEIAKEGDTVHKQELIDKKNLLQAGHPGFSREILQYNTASNEWIRTDSIPFNAPVTTTALKWNDEIIIPSGEIKAGIRSPNILSGKTLIK